MPRHSPSTAAERARSIMRRARNRFSGGSATVRSSITSIIVPPAPNVITGPNSSSVVTPTYSSRPLRLTTMRCIDTPSTFASGARRATSSIMSVKTVPTCCGVRTFSITPPTSDLWAISGELILMTTGKPTRRAIEIASSTVCATSVGVTGMRNALSNSFDSVSVSTSRPVASTALMIALARVTSGASSAPPTLSGGGVCMRLCWF